ncbi:MAG: aromatic acid exporter family protein, partial [Alkalibacterium sp.]
AAGIIAILSVLDTKKESIVTAFQRLASTLLAFFIATVIFYLFGFSVSTFSLYLLLYVPVAYSFNLQSGIAPCSVLVTHFVTAESISMYLQINGLLLMAIGAVVAILFNLWMPSYMKDLNLKVREIEEALRQFLNLFYTYLNGETGHHVLNTKARQLSALLDEAETVALLDYDNHLVDQNEYYIKYVQMRKRQLDLLKVMIQNITSVQLEIEQNSALADLFAEVARQLHEKNTGLQLLDNISVLYRHYRNSELPETREEFESRAILFQILRDIERFIEIKRDFFMSQQNEKKAANREDER